MAAFIVAEAGVNHNGDAAMAMDLVDVAAEAGADAVKFQTFRADRLVTRSAAKADYQVRNTGDAESQFEMLRKLELSSDLHERLAAHCREKKIHFMSTPFDPDSLRYLVEHFDMPYLKIPSGELTNPLLLLAAARSSRNIALSTGMANLAEVEDALAVLAFGFSPSPDRPGRNAFRVAFANPELRGTLARRVTLLHCTTDYPASIVDANLRAMDTMRDAFGVPVGYSDHTPGVAVAIAAAARGAAMIEKHFTLDKELPGPDHAASLEPDELGEMIAGIRAAEVALGSSAKAATQAEARNMSIARKSLVAATHIAVGENLSEQNLTVKRPGTGISPMEYFERIGTPATRDYRPEELI